MQLRKMSPDEFVARLARKAMKELADDVVAGLFAPGEVAKAPKKAARRVAKRVKKATVDTIHEATAPAPVPTMQDPDVIKMKRDRDGVWRAV